MVCLSPSSFTHKCVALLLPTHICRANVNWWQDKSAALNLTCPPKTFMCLVREFIEKEGLATFRGVELEDGAAVVNIDEIIFEPIAGVPADFLKLERDVKSISNELGEVKEAVLCCGKILEAFAQHDPRTAMTTEDITAAAADVDPVPDVQEGQFGSLAKSE